MGYTLEVSRIRAGCWEGVLQGPGAPEIEITHQQAALPGLECAADGAGRWRLSLPIPAEVLWDGVQTFLITDRRDGTRLGQFTIVTGVPLEDDLRAEIDLLRAELDMLKRAFRRHCVETGG
ncbi:hypothetical protein CCR83_09415 [Rhodobacter veldkampii DSM 11550]|uniref:Uncharacterized protein n=1 Tax=Phaeovulum veldkampii DSM 11550 TaxID=1185920 RepID=A0A2T4JLQ4_9RHOB|nr:hypothetical protein [Phaeovulum veldkampii]MBK5946644.1 hypothetical protein [Phaeovulum veldkampii DSM 11550]NCU20491.1 hypothetical protein [Candidatus Falkowbacteria bacterium]PTE18802.1 hypothetical protein C5F46_02700 [Phaeovulum veldkampii DSM 11550]TDQ59979.1 hypothetical protein EV658_10777 [Phaeovulum veldkampii DSM 11550]